MQYLCDSDILYTGLGGLQKPIDRVGAPTDGDAWRTAAQRVQKAEAAKKVVFFAVGIEGADMGVLKQLGPRPPESLPGLNFRELFRWLSSSLSGVAHSELGAEVPLQSPLGSGKV